MTNIEKNITKQRYNKQKKLPKHSTLKYFQKGNLFKPNAILTQLKNFLRMFQRFSLTNVPYKLFLQAFVRIFTK